MSADLPRTERLKDSEFTWVHYLSTQHRKIGEKKAVYHMFAIGDWGALIGTNPGRMIQLPGTVRTLA